eukprot:CAMPEP_0171418090 /NCGR_PEP_ID=MMETSP0880-20121228/40934_1 /TAXON_ID=67004 /ORGANISM="Thalassiosira weissflogii, Strain CCMP1336" /LENGTH=67 /DNA_ID=CAMNT_0011936361 /DNA_START=99 /DNA_END=302 /DNA_ORIENTATION=-
MTPIVSEVIGPIVNEPLSGWDTAQLNAQMVKIHSHGDFLFDLVEGCLVREECVCPLVNRGIHRQLGV